MRRAGLFACAPGIARDALLARRTTIVKFEKAFLSELMTQQVDFLRHTQCRYVQGYFYGKAMPLAEVLALSSQSSEQN